MKMSLVRAANLVIDHTNLVKNPGVSSTASSKGQGQGHIWVSLARYDDELVELLERWEAHTRDDGGHMGKRKKGVDHMGEEALSKVFEDGRWDKGKMVRSFARLGVIGKDPVLKEDSDKVRQSFLVINKLCMVTWADRRISRRPGRKDPHLHASAALRRELGGHPGGGAGRRRRCARA